MIRTSPRHGGIVVEPPEIPFPPKPPGVFSRLISALFGRRSSKNGNENGENMSPKSNASCNRRSSFFKRRNSGNMSPKDRMEEDNPDGTNSSRGSRGSRGSFKRFREGAHKQNNATAGGAEFPGNGCFGTGEGETVFDMLQNIFSISPPKKKQKSGKNDNRNCCVQYLWPEETRDVADPFDTTLHESPDKKLLSSPELDGENDDNCGDKNNKSPGVKSEEVVEFANPVQSQPPMSLEEVAALEIANNPFENRPIDQNIKLLQSILLFPKRDALELVVNAGSVPALNATLNAARAQIGSPTEHAMNLALCALFKSQVNVPRFFANGGSILDEKQIQDLLNKPQSSTGECPTYPGSNTLTPAPMTNNNERAMPAASTGERNSGLVPQITVAEVSAGLTDNSSHINEDDLYASSRNNSRIEESQKSDNYTAGKSKNNSEDLSAKPQLVQIQTSTSLEEVPTQKPEERALPGSVNFKSIQAGNNVWRPGSEALFNGSFQPFEQSTSSIAKDATKNPPSPSPSPKRKTLAPGDAAGSPAGEENHQSNKNNLTALNSNIGFSSFQSFGVTNNLAGMDIANTKEMEALMQAAGGSYGDKMINIQNTEEMAELMQAAGNSANSLQITNTKQMEEMMAQGSGGSKASKTIFL